MKDTQSGLIEFAYYIAPDDTEYPLFGGKRALMGWQNIGMPEIQHITDRGPFQHGETVRDYRFQPRIINLDIYERGCERDDFYCNEASLVDALRPNRSATAAAGRLLFVRPDNVEIEILAHILRGPSGDWGGGSNLSSFDLREPIRFLCPDPIFRLPTQVSTSFSVVAGAACLSMCVPFSLSDTQINSTTTITYTGTWDGDVLTIVITGPLTAPTITNTTTGKEIALNYSISTGEAVTISITPEEVTVTNNSGANLIGTVVSVSNLVSFALATVSETTSTGANLIRVTGSGVSDNTSIVLSYYIRHLSAFAPC